MFCGSYQPDDVQILLKPIDLPDTAIDEKERLIQSGKRHYSEMLSFEQLPSKQYLSLFHRALADNRGRMATDLIHLASQISETLSGPVTLISLARAGLPVGVILKHLLNRHYNRSTDHYSISIIRDRGIDHNALRYILQRHPERSLIFIDGWTGKGVIAAELKQSIEQFNQLEGTAIRSGLYVLSDLAGQAHAAASCDDYLIPSSILNATISGLVSRSVLNDRYIGASDFHGCLYYDQFQHADLSSWFVTQLLDEAGRQIDSGLNHPAPLIDQKQLQTISRQFIAEIKNSYGITDENHIKPGIGEATRVLLRRVPERLILRDRNDRSVDHLRTLASEKSVPVVFDATLPYRATALIKALNQ